jgi:signal transduction histidine kinase
VTRVRLAWALAILTGVAAVIDTVMTLESSSFFSEQAVAQHGWPFATTAVVSSSAMGALIVSRYPRHLIGWLFTATGAVGSLSLVCEAWSIWILSADGPGSAHFGHVVGWFSALIGAPLAIGLLGLVFLTAPDGRVLSARWRLAGWLMVVGVAVYCAGILVTPPGQVVVNEDQDFGLLPSLLTTIGILALVVGLVASAVSLVRRLRRSTGLLHQQLRWISAAAALIPFGLIWLLVLQGVRRHAEQQWMDSLPLLLSYVLFPISVAIAVLRHRLYDVDVIINRAVLLAVATAFVSVGYVTVVVLVGGNADGVWPSLLATALVALAFQPLRSRAVRLADRLAYGPRAVPYEALAEFSRRLGESPDPTALLPAIADTAAAAVNARRVVVTLLVPGGSDRVATWPVEPTSGMSEVAVGIPVVDRGEVLGHLQVEMAAGRSLRDRDLDLLKDIADQAAIAFRNARLTAELAARVEQLRLRALELSESRRRLITAGDAERRRLERAIARDVVPHLESLPRELDNLARVRDGTAGLLEPLVTASTAALEALREITRGVFPAQLVRGGLEPALRSYLGRSESRGILDLHESAANRRFDARAEAAAYFCVAEAAQSLEAPLHVSLGGPDGTLDLQVTGRSRGALDLEHIRDRVEAAGGTVGHDVLDGCTVLTVRLPTPLDEDAALVAAEASS